MGFLKFSFIVVGLIILAFLLYGGLGLVIGELTKPRPDTLVECAIEAQKEKLALVDFVKRYPRCGELITESARHNDLLNALEGIQYQIEDLELELWQR